MSVKLPKKPTLKKMPVKPAKSAPLSAWHKWEKDCDRINKENEQKLKPYNDAKKALEKSKTQKVKDSEAKDKILSKVKGLSGFSGIATRKKRK